MNALGELLRSRLDQLRDRGITVRKIADRAGLPESTVYELLKKREPSKTLPRQATLKKLAKGFQLDLAVVEVAAKESVQVLAGDPLQLLLRSAQVEQGVTVRQVQTRAKKKGHQISVGTISSVLSGAHANITEPVIEALAAGFNLPVDAVRVAAAQSGRRESYRLPAHLESQLTPERWAAVVRIVEATLSLGDDQRGG